MHFVNEKLTWWQEKCFSGNLGKYGWFQVSLVAQTVKSLPAMQESWIWSLGPEDPLEKEMATHFSTLAWKIPQTEEPGGLQSIGSPRDRVATLSFFQWMISENKFKRKTWHSSYWQSDIPWVKIITYKKLPQKQFTFKWHGLKIHYCFGI